MKIAILLFCIVIQLFAHPHYFLDSQITIEENLIKNIWKFDRLNSRLLMFEFDVNGNKKFDENEKKEFLKKHFEKLKDNNYNVFLANVDYEYKIIPKNMDVKFENKKVQILFEINYELKSDTTVCMMDEKIFIAYRLEKLTTKLNHEVQKSEYDYCIGVFR